MVSRPFRFLLGAVLLALSSSSWAQIIHWEIDGLFTDPGSTLSQERVFSGGFDFDTVTNKIFNVTIVSTPTTSANCILCWDYTGAEAGFFSEFDFMGIFFEKRIDFSETSYRENTLLLVNPDISTPGVIDVYMSEDAYWRAGTGNPVDDTFVNTPCIGSLTCATLTGTLVPVPEPETYAMLLAGLGIIGLRGRRKVS